MMEETPQNLSYGQRRLLAVVRSLATNPRVLLLDEPASGLDEVDVRQLAELLRHVARESSVGVLLVEHNVGMVMRVCDRIFVLDGGRVVATGTPAEVQANPDVVRAYLGPGTIRDDEPVSLPGAAS
jgi:ABC-type branched-subunit amino acid transport system ATPase component